MFKTALVLGLVIGAHAWPLKGGTLTQLHARYASDPLYCWCCTSTCLDLTGTSFPVLSSS
jgi:hypothetical protein